MLKILRILLRISEEEENYYYESMRVLQRAWPEWRCPLRYNKDHDYFVPLTAEQKHQEKFTYEWLSRQSNKHEYDISFTQDFDWLYQSLRDKYEGKKLPQDLVFSFC